MTGVKHIIVHTFLQNHPSITSWSVKDVTYSVGVWLSQTGYLIDLSNHKHEVDLGQL